ncbi:hypothetical protein BD408DRAFT_437207 [Parasitella parasitica]|nr:hypothetical protein BD408DRAFT_437207 [Parasitella parasitica]
MFPFEHIYVYREHPGGHSAKSNHKSHLERIEQCKDWYMHVIIYKCVRNRETWLTVTAGVQESSAYESRPERRGQHGSFRGVFSSGRRNQGAIKRADSGGFLKFKRARAEGKCVKCGKPYERGHAEICGQRRPPGVGLSPTVLNQEVFSTSVAPAAAKESSESSKLEDAESMAVDQDHLLSELAFQCKLPNVKAVKTETNFFALLTPLLICVESTKCIKVICKVDTGLQISCISLSFLIDVLKIKKVKKVECYLKFLSKSMKRVAMTFLLKFKYANGIVFEHALEVVQFEQGLDFEVLLGVDVLPKMNIVGLTGVAFRIDSEHQHSDATEHDERRMFENINFDFEGKHLEADNSPAGTLAEQAVVRLPTNEGATAHRHPYPIAEALKPVVAK